MASTGRTDRRLPRPSAGSRNDVDDIEESRRNNDLRLKKRFESIFDKYERDFSGIGDVVDLRSGTIEVDNGHFRSMRHEQDEGSRIRTSRRVTVEDEVEQRGGRPGRSLYEPASQFPQTYIPQPLPAPLPQLQTPNQWFQPQQPYATYQQNVVSLPVMNSTPQYNPFDQNSLLALIDQRVQAVLANHTLNETPRDRAIEPRWRTPRRRGSITQERPALMSNLYNDRRSESSGPQSRSSVGSDSNSLMNTVESANEQEAFADGGIWADGSVEDDTEEHQMGYDVTDNTQTEDRDNAGPDVSSALVPTTSLSAPEETGAMTNESRNLMYWEPREVELLVRLRNSGVRYKEIAARLPGRSVKACAAVWARLPDSVIQPYLARKKARRDAREQANAALMQRGDDPDAPARSDRDSGSHVAGQNKQPLGAETVITNHKASTADVSEAFPRKLERRGRKSIFTKEDDDTIVYLREEQKQTWANIEQQMPGRSTIGLKNRYYEILRQKKRLPIAQSAEKLSGQEFRSSGHAEMDGQLVDSTNNHTEKASGGTDSSFFIESEKREETNINHNRTQRDTNDQYDGSEHLRRNKVIQASPEATHQGPRIHRNSPSNLFVDQKDSREKSAKHAPVPAPHPHRYRSLWSHMRAPPKNTPDRERHSKIACQGDPVSNPKHVPSSEASLKRKRSKRPVVPNSQESVDNSSAPSPSNNFASGATNVEELHGNSDSSQQPANPDDEGSRASFPTQAGSSTYAHSPSEGPRRRRGRPPGSKTARVYSPVDPRLHDGPDQHSKSSAIQQSAAGKEFEMPLPDGSHTERDVEQERGSIHQPKDAQPKKKKYRASLPVQLHPTSAMTHTASRHPKSKPEAKPKARISLPARVPVVADSGSEDELGM